jgi:hypothetical protein
MITFTSTVNPMDSINLPNPKFGDTHAIKFKRINRTSRGNDLILVNPDPADWTPTFIHKYDFEYLSAWEFDNFKAFILRNLGTPVTVLGLYLTDTWTVIMIQPDAAFAHVGRENRTTVVDMQIVSII